VRHSIRSSRPPTGRRRRRWSGVERIDGVGVREAVVGGRPVPGSAREFHGCGPNGRGVDGVVLGGESDVPDVRGGTVVDDLDVVPAWISNMSACDSSASSSARGVPRAADRSASRASSLPTSSTRFGLSDDFSALSSAAATASPAEAGSAAIPPSSVSTPRFSSELGTALVGGAARVASCSGRSSLVGGCDGIEIGEGIVVATNAIVDAVC
jgi:hypothetical protein